MSRFTQHSPSTAAPRRTARTSWRNPAVILLVALAVGCSEPSAPAVSALDGPSFRNDVDRRHTVFNFQLRAIEDPNIIDDPNLKPSAAHGHLQLKVTRMGDGSVRIAYKGKLSNPERETFTGFSLGNSGLGRPGVFIAIGEVEGISDRRIDPEDATIVSAEVGARLFGTPDTIDDPNLLVAVFYTMEHPAGAISGERRLPAVQ